MASSSSTHQWKYDLFLSFRGEDTRKSFTDHLHRALRQSGVLTFMDDQLSRGEEIPPALVKAIEESRFSIVVFSENYAFSTWCLEELVKIIDCTKVMGHATFPVFYNVDPSHVRKQKGTFAQAFAKHEEVYKERMEKVVKWRKALTEAAEIAGWDSRDRHESALIEEIVRHVSNKLIGASLSYAEGLVGMDSHIKTMDSYLCLGSHEVLSVGIWGMGGVGKTTVARAIYSQIYTQFEGCCFLENVREGSQKHGLEQLQVELISKTLKEGNPNVGILNTRINFIKDRLHSRKVLIVLDDVDSMEQLEYLAGNHDWFGPGSRIIITGRDKHLLITQGCCEVYEVRGLENHEAVQLFRQYAFKHNQPGKEYGQLCYDVIRYTEGLPLALKVLGAFLYSKSLHEWKSELDKVKRIPNIQIQNVLKVGFDGLDDTEKDIFLDIACFFKGEDKDFVAEILESCGFFPDIGIRVLIDKSFITVLDNKLWMHDLLQEMGWEIVRQESVKCPGKRSRLWIHEDVSDVLTRNVGSGACEGLILDLSSSKELHFNSNAIAKMSNLRLLKICNMQLSGSFEYFNLKELCADSNAFTRMHKLKQFKDCKVHVSGDLKFLSDNLRCLHWHGYPSKYLPLNFHPRQLVELNMSYSQVEQLWKGFKMFIHLKYLKLSHSQFLIKTPDLSGVPNLRRLILEGCTSLFKVHPSIGTLNKLIFINLNDCKNLTSFLQSICMESLEILTLSGSSKLKKFPEIQGGMKHLSELSLEGTAIKQLPLSIEFLTGLVLLNLKNCQTLGSLPNCIYKLRSLEILILSDCLKLKELPDILENMGSLLELFLDGTAIKELPSSIQHLTGLILLNLRGCKSLASLPQSICKLKCLQTLIISGCSKLVKLPEGLGSLQGLLNLKADGTAIKELPTSISLLENLEVLSFEGCKGLECKPMNSFASLFSLRSLRKLNLSDCNILEGAIPSDIFSSLCSLGHLDLSRNNFVTLPASLSQLSQLRNLRLGYCKMLQSLPELPSSIEEIDAHDCRALENVSCPSSVYTSEQCGGLRFTFSNCFKLSANETSNFVAATLREMQSLANKLPRFQFPIQMRPFTPHIESSTFVPASRIPEWFSHQSTGSTVLIHLPRNWCNDRLMGLAVCAVFVVKAVIHDCPGNIFCHLHLAQGTTTHFFAPMNPAQWYSCNKGHRCIKSDHMWLGYQPISRIGNGHASYLNKLSQIQASFQVYGPSIEVKKCGVHLLYEQDEKVDILPEYECNTTDENSRFFTIADLGEHTPLFLKMLI